MRILVSGASIAGPVLAYWLTRYGFTVTVVERAPRLRKAGGHAVDLFRPAMDISEKMGELSSALKANPGESITVSFANVPTGTYNFHCTPHLAMGMKGVVTVQ